MKFSPFSRPASYTISDAHSEYSSAIVIEEVTDVQSQQDKCHRRVKTGDQITLLNTGDVSCGFGTCLLLTGDAANLGGFEVREKHTASTTSFSFPDDPRVALEGQDVRRIRVIWKASVGLKEGPVSFDIVLDVVDKVE